MNNELHNIIKEIQEIKNKIEPLLMISSGIK